MMARKCNLLVVALLLSAVSCRKTTTEYGPAMTEPATVVDNLFSPSYHGTKTTSTLAIDFDGDVTMKPTTVSVSIPEKWGVVFRCQHGKFIVMGGLGSDGRRMFNKFDPGDRCKVVYREVYRVVRDRDKEITRELIDYDFLDAHHVEAEKTNDN